MNQAEIKRESAVNKSFKIYARCRKGKNQQEIDVPILDQKECNAIWRCMKIIVKASSHSSITMAVEKIADTKNNILITTNWEYAGKPMETVNADEHHEAIFVMKPVFDSSSGWGAKPTLKVKIYCDGKPIITWLMKVYCARAGKRSRPEKDLQEKRKATGTFYGVHITLDNDELSYKLLKDPIPVETDDGAKFPGIDSIRSTSIQYTQPKHSAKKRTRDEFMSTTPPSAQIIFPSSVKKEQFTIPAPAPKFDENDFNNQPTVASQQVNSQWAMINEVEFTPEPAPKRIAARSGTSPKASYCFGDNSKPTMFNRESFFVKQQQEEAVQEVPQFSLDNVAFDNNVLTEEDISLAYFTENVPDSFLRSSNSSLNNSSDGALLQSFYDFVPPHPYSSFYQP